MITTADIIEIGRFLKTHGVGGEIVFAPLYDLDLTQLRCVVIDVDGIFVPFFVEKVRPKGDNLLVKIADINDEKQAATLTHKDVFAMADDVEIADEEDDDGFSAYRFKGYTVVDHATNHPIGVIEYIDDTTQNWLFMVRPSSNPEGALIAIPIADEFVTDIDTKNRSLTLDLPKGLLEL